MLLEQLLFYFHFMPDFFISVDAIFRHLPKNYENDDPPMSTFL